MVTNYADLIVKMIDSVDPQAGCASIGLCTPRLLSKARIPAVPAPLLRALTPAVTKLNALASGATGVQQANGNM